MLYVLHHNYQGFTLVQMLICLSLLLGLGQWLNLSLYPLWQQQQLYQSMTALQQHIEWAQTQAVLWQENVSMCLIRHQQCTQDWHGEIALFIDRNHDQQFQPDDDIPLNRWYLPQNSAHIDFNQTVPVVFTAYSFQRTGSWHFTSRYPAHAYFIDHRTRSSNS